jgi:murein DD-endopeptidase MepM/ murein hydrolase activator NlpD
MIDPKKYWYLSLLIISLLGSSACAKSGTTLYLAPTELSVYAKSTDAPAPTTTPIPQITNFIEPAVVIEKSIKLQAKLTDATPEPIQFEMVLPDSQSVSDWRPPLYPVPLALTPFDHFYFSKPFSANEHPWPVEDYRYGGAFFEDIVHSGMDIKIPIGTPVIASGPGKVIWAGYGLFSGKYDPEDPYGKAVMIRHDFGYKGQRLYTVYAHLDQVAVEQDQYVESGEFLGLSGKTGKTSGPHLHFEVRLDVNGFFATRNPELWLVPPQGYGVLAGQVMNTGGRKVEGQLIIVRPLESDQFWRANSYHYGHINPDDYYQENLVISDLPAGKYEISINYLSKIYRREIEIYPGLVTYFSFRGRSGFTSEAPPLPGGDFNPPQTP